MKLSPVDLNLLVVFHAILETRSVGKAADRVGITKPAMSHALARLRAQIGDPVLVRAGKEWKLTERAAALAPRVRDLCEGARAVLDREPSFDPKSAQREFRVHASDHVLALLGTPLGHAVAREAPSVSLRFLPMLPDDASPLREGQVDLALGVFPEMPPEFRTQALFQERFACVVRRGHPKIHGKMSLDCFLALKHVLVAPRGRSGSAVDAALRARGLERKVTRYVPYFVVALDLVSRSDCVVTISERLAEAYAARCGLQVLKPPIALAPYTISQVWHPRVDADPGHVWLRQRIAEVAFAMAGKRRVRAVRA